METKVMNVRQALFGKKWTDIQGMGTGGAECEAAAGFMEEKNYTGLGNNPV